MTNLAARLPIAPSDLRGLARLGIDAVVGVTNIVESMHHTLLSLMAARHAA